MSDGILFIGKTNKIIVDQLELSKEQVDGEWFVSFFLGWDQIENTYWDYLAFT